MRLRQANNGQEMYQLAAVENKMMKYLKQSSGRLRTSRINTLYTGTLMERWKKLTLLATSLLPSSDQLREPALDILAQQRTTDQPLPLQETTVVPLLCTHKSASYAMKCELSYLAEVL